MGYIRHNAIVVTTFSSTRIGKLHKRAVEVCGDLVSEIVGPQINDTYTFLVAPDGSKEGWAESEQGDLQRKALKAYLRADPDDCYPEWVEIAYSPDDQDSMIVESAWLSDSADLARSDK